jgi:L-rhamnose mutarotase
MERRAFAMKLKPGMKDEYKRRHERIWPELVSLLKDAGVHDYTIFLDERTNTLFGVQRVDGEHGSQELGAQRIVQEWWHHMADIMETNPDESPVTISLEEVFHMD